MTVWRRLVWAAVIMGCVLATWWFLSSRLPVVEENGAALRNEKRADMLPDEQAPDAPSDTTQTATTRRPSHRTPMRRGANIIHGLVKDADGAPVADVPVRVALVDYQDGWPVHVEGRRDNARSDDTGAFELKYMPNGIVVFIAETDGMAGLGMVQLNTAWQTEYEVVIVMEPALAIAGRVVDEAGNAVAGATVFPFGDQPDASLNSQILSGYGPVFTATTEDDGAFSLSPIVGSAVTLLAHADAYAPLVTDPLESGSTDNTVVLTRGTTISGRVLSVPDHQGVPGVTVLVSHDGVPTRSHAVTDNAGAFIAAGVPDGDHWLDVDGTEWLLAGQSPAISVADGGAVDGVDVYVGRGGVVEGRVYDPATGEAIAGVKVSFADYRSEPSRHNGSYRVEGVQAGSYQIGYEDAPGVPRQHQNLKPMVRVEFGGTHHMDVAIPLGSPLTGRVTTKDGAPIEGAFLMAGNNRGISCNASSRADGTFVLRGHDAGDVIHLHASKDGFLPRQIDTIVVGDERTKDLAVVLDPAARVQGRVTDSAGRPVGGVLVLVDAPSGDQHRSAPSPVFTNPAGDFDIRSIEAGTWSICAARDMPPVPPTENVRTVEAVQGEMVRVDLELPALKDYAIAGFVRDTAGAPRAKAHVWAQPLMLHEALQSGGGFDPTSPEPTGIAISTTTDAAGHFELTVHQDGLFRVGAQTRGARRPEQDVHAGDTNVELVVARAAGIEGHIVSAATGAPIPQFELLTTDTIMFNAVPTEYQSFRRFYDPDGSFRIDQVQPGALTILARAPGGTVTSQVVDVADGETLRGVVLRIAEGATVVGAVRDAQGSPVPGASIFLGDVPETYEQGNQQSAVADALGAYVLEFLPAGVTTVSAYQRGHMLTSRTVTLRAGQENTVDLVLNSGGVLTGRVMQGRLPVPYARVSASPDEGGALHETTTDAQGQYNLSGLRTATYNVSAQTQNAGASTTRQSISADADIDERYPTNLDLLLPPAAVTLEGVITSDNPEPGRVFISGVVFSDEQQVQFQTELVDERSYLIDNLPAGKISVVAQLQRGGSKNSTKSAEIDASAGGDFQLDFHFKSIGSLRVAIASEFEEHLILFVAPGELPWDGGAPDEFTQRLLEMRADFAVVRPESPEWLFDTLEHGRYTVFASGTLGETSVFDYAIVDIDGEEPIDLELHLREHRNEE